MPKLIIDSQQEISSRMLERLARELGAGVTIRPYYPDGVHELPPLEPETGVPDSAHRELFWKDVLEGSLPLPGDDGAGHPQHTVTPILLEIKDWQQELDPAGKSAAAEAIQKLARQILAPNGEVLSVFQVRDDITSVILEFEPQSPVWLAERCVELTRECENRLGVRLSCCLGEATGDEGLREMFGRMMTLTRENVTGQSLLLLRFGLQEKGAPLKEPDFAGWKTMLMCGQYDPMLIGLSDFCMSAMASNRLTFGFLQRFRHDLLQVLYVTLSEKGVPASEVFNKEKGNTMLVSAADSVSEFLTWAFWCVGELSACLDSAQSREAKLKKITDYITGNLAGELTRQELARRAGMSESALSRLFKKQTGLTITEFIFNQRLREVKQLLSATNVPVGEVAERCGFRNYPYFYSRFRSAVGMNPTEFRAFTKNTRK